MTGLNRRSFLAGTAAAAAVPFAAAEAKCTDPMPVKWDEAIDVIVIGSGFAGLAAACEAKDQGAGSVVVLEKMRAPGGNSSINGGIMSVPGSAWQKELGIEDSPQKLADDMIREGLGYNYPEKVKALTDAALANFDWLVNEIGVEFVKGKVSQEGGHSVPRHVTTTNGSGSGIVNKQLEYAKKKDIPVRLRCYVERIIRDDDGRVKGVKVREGYRFPDAASGKVKYLRANKALILCYGGFGADVKFRMKFDPKLTEKFDTTNQPGATSELWREASRIGCNMIQTDWIQCGPWNSPEEKGMGIALFFAQGAAATMGMWVDCTTGRRFVNELANRKVRADAVINNNNKGHVCIALSDQNALDLTINQTRKGLIDKMIQRGCVHKFDTLEALAKEFKIPMDKLQKSIDDYNKALAGEGTDEMGRMFTRRAKPIGTGPWYCSILSPKVHHCMGGVETNSLGQVIDISTDKPIPGLYAAGESTGGVHGAVRLGSCATMDCLVNGRIAGANAAKEKAWA
jgi:flavocytochrome c